MSHTGVDVIDFLLITIYPVAGIFAVEMASRIIRAPKWVKLLAQALTCIGFAVAYFSFPGDEKFPLTAVVLLALAAALFYQARRARVSPESSPY